MNTIKELIESNEKLIIVPTDGGLSGTLKQINFAYKAAKTQGRRVVVVTQDGHPGAYLPWIINPIPGVTFCRSAIFSAGKVLINGELEISATQLTKKGGVPSKSRVVYVNRPYYPADIENLLKHISVRPALLPAIETPELPTSYCAVHLRHTDYRTDYKAVIDGLPLDGTKYVVCTDSAEVYAYAKQVLGTAIHPIQRNRATGEQNTHEGCGYGTALEAWADLRIMIGAERLITAPILPDPDRVQTVAGTWRSGFSRIAEIVREQPTRYSLFSASSGGDAHSVAVGMASHPPREAGLLASVPKLLPQCDELFLYLNNYSDDILSKLPYSDKITAILAGDNRYFADLRTRGKHFGAQGWQGYYITMDDDILCRDDYTAHFKAALDKYDRNAVIVTMGRPADGTLWITHAPPVPQDTVATTISSAACGYCPSDIGFSLDIFTADVKYGDDTFLAIWANEQEIPCIIAARPANWAPPDSELRYVQAFSSSAAKQTFVKARVMERKWKDIVVPGTVRATPPPAPTPQRPRRSFPYNTLGRNTVNRDPRFRHIKSHFR